ncbi:MAG: hypothetical protein K9M07_06095 [Simkaniaceae bacterium]|nr:hypothetical protein [Simkaniaceae bacterium]MCF7852793.1 hypothetical protein [Simkaniaceae bacterium]
MKILWRILIGSIILIFIGISLCYTLLPSIVSHTLSKRAQVEVNIDGITLSLSSLSIRDFVMGNPPRSILPQALKIGKTEANVPISHFFKEKILIPTMNLNNLYVGLEFNSKSDHRGNWTYIMKNLNDSNSSDPNSNTEVLIKQLNLNDITVAIVYKDQPKKIRTVHISSLQFTDVSSQGGIPTAQITQLIMRYALQQIFSKENLQNMIQDIISPNKGGFFKSFQGLFSLKLQYKEDEQPLPN